MNCTRSSTVQSVAKNALRDFVTPSAVNSLSAVPTAVAAENGGKKWMRAGSPGFTSAPFSVLGKQAPGGTRRHRMEMDGKEGETCRKVLVHRSKTALDSINTALKRVLHQTEKISAEIWRTSDELQTPRHAQCNNTYP